MYAYAKILARALNGHMGLFHRDRQVVDLRVLFKDDVSNALRNGLEKQPGRALHNVPDVPGSPGKRRGSAKRAVAESTQGAKRPVTVIWHFTINSVKTMAVMPFLDV